MIAMTEEIETIEKNYFKASNKKKRKVQIKSKTFVCRLQFYMASNVLSIRTDNDHNCSQFLLSEICTTSLKMGFYFANRYVLPSSFKNSSAQWIMLIIKERTRKQNKIVYFRHTLSHFVAPIPRTEFGVLRALFFRS